MGGNRIHLRQLQLDDAPALLELRVRNRAFLQPFEPIVSEDHYTLAGQQAVLEQMQHSWERGSGYAMGIFLSITDQLIGRVSLANVVRGAWDSCTIGYFLDQRLSGQGMTTEAVRGAVDFAFGPAGLHRLQAGVMPRNLGSIRVLEKVGFRYDGFAEYYLKINGVWEHHNLYSLTTERWRRAH